MPVFVKADTGIFFLINPVTIYHFFRILSSKESEFYDFISVILKFK